MYLHGIFTNTPRISTARPNDGWKTGELLNFQGITGIATYPSTTVGEASTGSTALRLLGSGSWHEGHVMLMSLVTFLIYNRIQVFAGDS